MINEGLKSYNRSHSLCVGVEQMFQIRIYHPVIFIAAIAIGAAQFRHAAADTIIVDRRVSIATQGQGTDIIFVPGMASSSHIWDGVVEHLMLRYRVHVVQVFGYAGTAPEANNSGFVLKGVADAINDYITANRIRSAVIVGHSVGGLIALEMALYHGENVKRLILVDSLPFFGAVFGAKDANAIAARAAAIRDHMKSETQVQYAAETARSFRSLIKSRNEAATAAERAAAASDHCIVAESMYEQLTTDVRQKIRSINKPVTIIYPFDNIYSDRKNVVDGFYRSQYSYLENASFVRVDGSRHFIMIDQPLVLYSVLDSIFAREKRGSSR